MPADTASIAVSNLTKTTDIGTRLAYIDTLGAMVYARRAHARKHRSSSAAPSPSPPPPPSPTPSPPPPPPPSPPPPPPPPAPAPSGSFNTAMAIGFNLSPPYYVDGATPWANLVWGGERFVKLGDYTFWPDQVNGIITSASVSQQCLTIIADPGFMDLPAGDYTWRNPDGNKIGIGDNAAAPNLVAYTTSLSGTFVLGADAGLALFVMGNTTNNAGTPAGGIQILLPDHVTSWDSGDWFNSQYLTFHSAASTQVLRTMDWTSTNGNIDSEWSQRPVHTKILLRGNNGDIAWENVIALANRLNKPAWICVPHRATDSYVSNMAALFAATYSVGALYVEYANEIWNTGATVFRRQTNWVNYLPHTRYTASAAGNLFTRTAHGWANDKNLIGFLHVKVNNVDDLNHPGWWEGTSGLNLYVVSVDANTVQLRDSAGGAGTLISAPDGATSILLIDPAEVGKSTDLENNYTTRAKQIWDIFDAHMGASAVQAVMAGQWANSDLTRSRLSSTAIASRVNFFAVAPYFAGDQMGGAASRSSNTIIPKFWSNVNCSAVAAVYTAGATPTIAQIKAGTGAVGVGAAVHSASGTAYTNLSAVTVVDGTTYKVHFVATDPHGYTWTWSGNVSASATADVVDVLDTYQNQQFRSLRAVDDPNGDYRNFKMQAKSHSDYATAINSAIRLVAYEGGSHEDQNQFQRPTAINAWMEGYWEDQKYADALQLYLKHNACIGFVRFCLFVDLDASGPWAVADTNYDTSDLRFVAVSSLSGNATVATPIDISAVNATRLAADPGAFPHKVHSFTATLTYQIVCNTDNANFTVSSRAVELLSNTGLDFASANTLTVRMWARDSNSFDFFNFALPIGPEAWYESDALFAWNSSSDSTTSGINPDVGNVISATNSVATVTSGLWQNGSTTGYTGGGLASTADFATKSYLLAFAAQKGSAANGSYIVRNGIIPLIGGMAGGGATQVVFYMNNGTHENDVQAGSLDATTRIYWYFYDQALNKAYYGNNQTLANPAGSAGDTPVTAQTTTILGTFLDFASNHPVIYGTTQIVNRAGMNISGALAVIQKMQNVHGL